MSNIKNIAVLGSAGSIGGQTLEVLRKHRDKFNLYALVSYDEVDIAKEQVEEFNPERVALFNQKAAKALSALVGLQVEHSMKAIIDIARDENVDIVVNAISGAAGLLPGLAAAESEKRLASANKECFVMAGHIFQNMLNNENNSSKIIPIDSEHSALLQASLSGKKNEISRLILTASGGPFFNVDIDFDKVTPAQALNHPNWSMGPRITIDSATMFNKGLEVIEARWLFDIPPDKIDVLVHPQSIIHSIVEFDDLSQIAQLSVPDMRLPIQYALSFPSRIESQIESLDLAKLGSLTFFEPNYEKFPALSLCFDALEIGGVAPTVLNAADEVAVKLFLKEKIAFADIFRILEKTISKFQSDSKYPDIETILQTDKEVRNWVSSNFG